MSSSTADRRREFVRLYTEQELARAAARSALVLGNRDGPEVLGFYHLKYRFEAAALRYAEALIKEGAGGGDEF